MAVEKKKNVIVVLYDPLVSIESTVAFYEDGVGYNLNPIQVEVARYGGEDVIFILCEPC